MFDDIVERYDVLNTVLSLGLDRLWRRAAVREMDGVGRPVLDLGCGTGDLVRGVGVARCVGLDVSEAMLRRARTRVGSQARLVRGSAFALPFRDGAFAGAGSGFVLRNLEDLPRAFAELARVVKPGGRVALVDITEPRNLTMRRLFDAYFRTVAPALGALVRKREAYTYLTRSLAQLPPPDEVARMLDDAGFGHTAARSLTGGVVTLFTGVRRERRNLHG